MEATEAMEATPGAGSGATPVDLESLVGLTQQLNASVEALAALAAAMRLRAEGLDADPRIAERLAQVTDALGIGADDLGRLSPEQLTTVTGTVRALFRQAHDLIEHPTRPSGWSHDDPALLQSQGRASMLVAPLVAGAAPDLADLSERLDSGSGRFLDIGTGVGLLAVAMAQTFPRLRTVGIDVWPPALQLAAANIEDFEVADRIELRHQSILDLADGDVFDLAWVPGPFLPLEIISATLERTIAALRPGGWVVFGLYGAAAPNPLAEALTDLRVVRSGGHPFTPDEAGSALVDAGFGDVRAIERTWNAPIGLVVGQKPG